VATDHEKRVDQVEERTTPSTPVIYDSVRRLGVAEMERPAVSLWWSGIAAGLSISFSLLAQGILALHLPDAPWRELVIALGYPIGFVMVVLSRQQLFTENTITVVLPVMAQPSLHKLGQAARLWAIVLAANLVGTFASALLIVFTPAVPPDLLASMLDVSRRALQHGWLEMIFLGVTSGYLMAAMVWLIPAAGAAQFHVIVLMTYLIGVGGFAHIVAGSVEGFLLLVNGDLGLSTLLMQFLAPVLVGNIVGGTALFALISYAQVMREM
jgi:formate/nitrite transporter FocA (FNT family)